MKIIVVILSLLFGLNLYAAIGSVTGLNIPRFVSLKSNEANLRVGPSVNYPINIKYVLKNIPVEIIDEFDVWRKIRDANDNIGWLHKSLIKGDRFVQIFSKVNVEKKIFNRPNGEIIGLIKNNNIIKLDKCLINWCHVSNDKLNGWVTKKNLWGVYNKEIYNLGYFQFLVDKYWQVLDYNLFDKTGKFIMSIEKN